MEIDDFLNTKEYESRVLSGNYSDDDIKELLKSLDDEVSFDDLKDMIESCLKNKPKSFEDLLACIKERIKNKNKLKDANINDVKKDQERRTIKSNSKNKR
ncbi:hypothetical protein [Shewanella nanhaiensis]|uniref:Uncharacterized protein n=1 Tax=Shewanella nanhaiensis TaxID=2864872 RepID=A0ABS7E0Z1_9GAMM|nr:hypothetical protein [Shewanella nanhaiensis]MBW8183287.1 hypothetical protein [Shewanella nanhaiensis]